MSRTRAISLAGLLLAAGGWLFYTCGVNQKISFLTSGPGFWIVYPTPPSVPILDVMPMTTVFRRVFVLPKSPAAATVSWRCLKAGQFSLNGQSTAAKLPARWKETARLDVARYLRAGTNQMEARVTCDNGLPALSLELEADGFALKSDETWQSSLEGAVWQPAWLASKTIQPGPGNGLYGAEDIQRAFRESWPLLSLFVIVAALAVAMCGRWGGLLFGENRAAGLLLLAAVWMLLFLHNFPLLPAMMGFDAPAHLAYIDYIQQHAALPSPVGWEYFQGPLYYLLGADLLGLLHLRVVQPEAGQVLGLLNLLMGAIELALILAGLRLLFPGRRRLQFAGLLLGAFLPAQVYLLHYPTNETIGAVTTTAALLFCLKILRRANPPLAWRAGLGVMLGLALLSKSSAVVALAVVFLALTAKAWVEKQAPFVFLRQTGLTFGVCLLVGGFQYWRLWRQFGNPLAGAWDPAVGGGWWQLPGYRTPGYYLAFGQSLVRPLFSGFHSFWDSLYSTWWGDGLMGGESILYGGPPWNYSLMTTGYVLALVPSALVLTGLGRALCEGLRQRRLDWLFLAALPLMYGFAIFSMSLKLPYYALAKAFYALPVVLPFCALGVLGLDFWAARFQRARPFLPMWLGVWLLNVYASFWIRPDTVQSRLSAAIALYKVPHQDPAPFLARVLALDPHNPEAIVSLAFLDRAAGHLALAVFRLETAAESHANATIDTGLAQCLGEQGRMAEALEWARRANELTLDYPGAPTVLCSLALRAGQNEEAARAGSLALRLKPQNGEVHFNVGLALERMNRHEEAASQFSEALDCSPQRADGHYWLGMALWNLPGRKAEARDQVAAALQMDPQNAVWKTKLAEMQQELGVPGR
jgi:tetratricopeptide (TPR) repeat protein